MQILITTQYRENYGSHTWDGTGACPQYWKNKGGDNYLIEGVESTDDFEFLVTKATESFGCNYASEYSSEEVLGWLIYDDNENLGLEEYELAHLKTTSAATLR